MNNFSSNASEVFLATGFFSRLKGLLFMPPSSRVIMLSPCKSVHTFGMSYSLDIAFITKEGVVLEVRRDVSPSRRIKNHQAHTVLERKACLNPWYTPGDQVVFEGYIKM